MGLETGTYISSLVATNPVAGDNKTEGDDHLRLIKATLLATFPNLTAATTIGSAKNFAAYRSTNQTSGGTVIFNTELYDTGTNYDNATGIFTAPLAGIYIFTASITIANSTGVTHYPYISLNYNNSYSFGYAQTIAVTSGTGAICVCGLKSLAANDTVRISVSNEAAGSLAADFYVIGQTASVFSGHLLA